MKVEFLLNEKYNIEITEDDKIQLNKLKEDFEIELDEYIQFERDELDILLSMHLLKSQKLGELHNIRFDIINNLDYSTTYRNIFNINDRFVNFDNDELFIYFAFSYNILEDTSRAIRVLRNIARVKLIDRIIEIDHSDKQENQPNQLNYNNKVFVNEISQRFFEYTVKYFLNDITKPKTAISFIFRKMWSDESPKAKYQIKCKQIQFAYYWNEKVLHKHSYKIQIDGKSAKLKTFTEITNFSNYDTQFNSLIKDFEKNGG